MLIISIYKKRVGVRESITEKKCEYSIFMFFKEKRVWNERGKEWTRKTKSESD